jgi:deferrochelatase/peroxidase EfeB
VTATDRKHPSAGRRRFLTSASLSAVALPLARAAQGATSATGNANRPPPATAPAVVPFLGRHQAGIATPIQRHTYFVAFDLTTAQRDDLVRLLRSWSEAANRMTAGPSSFDPHADIDRPNDESGAAVGLPASRLTITFGFGPSLFDKAGVDRFGLAAQRPAALVDLPRFAGDQLVAGRTGGDLSVQASADDPQVVDYAIRQIARLANGVATMRWAQTGFTGGFKANETPRNLMGFKDGTMNIATDDPAAMDRFVWVGDEGPAWLRDGSYLVTRPIRISLEHWDQMKQSFQEETIGRHKVSGAPIGKKNEFDPLDLQAADADGNPLIAENSHAAMAAPENNDGAQILRRAFSYDNGLVQTAERWPPWRQLVTFDAGLLFQCYQRDPGQGFVKIFTKMAQIDMLNQFTTHVGSGLFAVPPGAGPGEFVGQRMFG